jgi:hypothetical protein
MTYKHYGVQIIVGILLQNTVKHELTSGKWPCRYLTVRELFPTPPLPTTQMVSLFSELLGWCPLALSDSEE